MLQLHIIVLYEKLIHKARTHLNYFQEATGKLIPGPWELTVLHDPYKMSSISAEFGSFRNAARDPRSIL